MSQILIVAGPFVLFTLLNNLLVETTKQKFGVSLPVTMMVSALVMLICQFLTKTFLTGYLLLMLGAAAGAWMTVRAIRRKEAQRIFTWGLASFILLVLLFLVVDYNRNYFTWDELSHWAVMTKEMLRTDRFYSEACSNLLVHKDYPPFISLVEMIWCKAAGGYSETTLTMGLHMFMFSMMVPFLAERISEVAGQMHWSTSERGNAKVRMLNMILVCAALIIGFVMLFSSLDMSEKFNSILPDMVMSIMYGYAAALILDREMIHSAFGFVSLIITCVSLILTKQMAITFILLLWFIYTLLELIEIRGRKMTGKDWMFLGLRSFLPLIWTVVFYKIWGAYTASLGLVGQFDFSKISIGSIVGLLRGVGNEFQLDARTNYFQHLVSYPLFTGGAAISYLHLFLLALLFVILLYIFGKGEIKRSEMWALEGLFTLGAVGYALAMFVLYMFCFSESEMARLAGYRRYMGAYIQGMYLILAFLLVRVIIARSMQIEEPSAIAAQPKRRPLLYPATLLLVCVTVLGILLGGVGRLEVLKPQALRKNETLPYQQKAEYLESMVPAGSKVMLISSENLIETYAINCYANDLKLEKRTMYWEITEMVNEETDTWQELRGYLAENEYLFVVDSSESVDGRLGSYTETGSIEPFGIYQVIPDGASFKLKLVEEPQG